jgi:mycothiol synthase
MAAVGGYDVRAPSPDELDAIAEVLMADGLDDAGSTDLDADFVATQWSRPGFDLSTDAWAAVDDAGTVVGYGQVLREEPGVLGSWGVVHPAHRGRGLGTALLERIVARASGLAAGLPSARFRHGINAGDRVAATLLLSRGLRPLRHFWHMQIDLPRPVDPGPAPDGIRIAGIEGHHDVVAMHSVLAEALSGEWRGRPGAFDPWWEEATRSPNHDPTLWLLATAEGEPAGALTASVSGGRGWVDEIGVLSTFRGRGIAAALLRRSFAAFARRGVPWAMVNVDAENPTGATALYERVGMRAVWRWDLWEGSLGDSP